MLAATRELMAWRLASRNPHHHHLSASHLIQSRSIRFLRLHPCGAVTDLILLGPPTAEELSHHIPKGSTLHHNTAKGTLHHHHLILHNHLAQIEGSNPCSLMSSSTSSMLSRWWTPFSFLLASTSSTSTITSLTAATTISYTLLSPVQNRYNSIISMKPDSVVTKSRNEKDKHFINEKHKSPSYRYKNCL